jgi:hypothetical protein
MASILKVDTIQDQSGNNIINENADTITIGASGDTITIPTGATYLMVALSQGITIADSMEITAISQLVQMLIYNNNLERIDDTD